MSTFSNKDGDVMVKCEGVTNGYTKYVHFVHLLNIRDGSWIGKMLSFVGGGRSFPVTRSWFNFKLLL